MLCVYCVVHDILPETGNGWLGLIVVRGTFECGLIEILRICSYGLLDFEILFELDFLMVIFLLILLLRLIGVFRATQRFGNRVRNQKVD